MDKPDVDFIEGLSPAVSIDQKSTNRNPRSTVGTITEVYDYLRLLYARIGTPHCPVCGEPIARQTPQQIVDQVLALAEGTRFQVLAPVVRARKGEFVDLFDKLADPGLQPGPGRRRGHRLTEPPTLKKQEKHDYRGGRRPADGQAAPRRNGSPIRWRPRWVSADGIVVLEFVDLDDTTRTASHLLRAPRLSRRPLSVDDLEPRSFSFNSPVRRLPGVQRPGHPQEVDPELVVPDDRPVPGRRRGGAMGEGPQLRLLRAGCSRLGDEWGRAWTRRGASCRRRSARRSSTGLSRCTCDTATATAGQRSYYTWFEGVIPFVQRRHSGGRHRHEPGALRGLHARGPLPGVRRARGSSPSRSPSRCEAAASPTCWACRWAEAADSWGPPPVRPRAARRRRGC